MYKLFLDSNIVKAHMEYYSNRIIDNFNDTEPAPLPEEIDEYNKTDCYDDVAFKKDHRLFIDYVRKNKDIFAIGKPSELRSLECNMTENFIRIKQMIDCDLRLRKQKKKIVNLYVDELYNLFGYEKFSTKDFLYYVINYSSKLVGRTNYCPAVQVKSVEILCELFTEKKEELTTVLSSKLNRPEFDEVFRGIKGIDVTVLNLDVVNKLFEGEWNDYLFVLRSNIRVCPYCNKQYINPIFSDNGKARADIDHFWSKSRYPYFSMSLYNLIPSCKMCNQSLKGSRTFDIDAIHPYEESYNDYFMFEVDELTHEIFAKSRNPQIEHYLNTFKIEAQYNYHRNQVEELVKKKMAYPDPYLEQMAKNPDCDFTEDELKQLIFGNLRDEAIINDEAFLKFRRDIAKQLGILF